ncbi:transmembrane protein, putative [Medicago truncatula]|uniref:Transmembrane protein, putative n=1 Tax=Medicago truncatula TaxID=3880 RepID=A0A072VHW1_MEDTR|nr:transmembrane protein, putative [Medicago truncatula]
MGCENLKMGCEMGLFLRSITLLVLHSPSFFILSSYEFAFDFDRNLIMELYDHALPLNVLNIEVAQNTRVEEPKLVPIGVVYKVRNTASFFTTNARWREREELPDWVRRQGARAEFTICIDKSSLKRSYLTMQRERSGIYKPPKTRKKRNLESAQGNVNVRLD